MNKSDFQKFFKYITAATTNTNPSPERTQVYYDMLNDLDFEVAMVGAKRVIATMENPFLPMPAVFRNAALQVTGKETLPWPDAYDQVLRAVRNFGVHRSNEAIESLTPINRAAMRSLGGFQAFCINEENDTNRAQFRMAYETLAKRETMDAKTPQKLKDLMAGMGKTVPALPGPVTFVPRNISAPELPEDMDEIGDVEAESNQIREMLARTVKNRRGEMKVETQTELDEEYLEIINEEQEDGEAEWG